MRGKGGMLVMNMHQELPWSDIWARSYKQVYASVNWYQTVQITKPARKSNVAMRLSFLFSTHSMPVNNANSGV